MESMMRTILLLLDEKKKREQEVQKWEKEGIAESRTKDDGSFSYFPFFLIMLMTRQEFRSLIGNHD